MSLPIASRAVPAFLRPSLLALALLGLAVFFYSPVRELAEVNLDGSNHSSYAYFTAHGFQYGSEVVPMAGPYGFVLYGWSYSGELFWARALGQAVLAGALAALTLWFFLRHWRTPLAWLWLPAQLAFTPFHDDLLIEWTLLLGGLYLALPGEHRGRAAATGVVAALLAFLSLIKGTQLALGFATTAVVLGAHAARRDRRQIATVAGAYFGALVVLWLAAGQNPLHLPGYLHGTLELANGYNGAMSLDEPTALFQRGVSVCGLLGATLLAALWTRRRDAAAVGALLLFAGHSFVQWKHGFVRADGHAYIFFHYAIVGALAIALVAWHQPGRGAPRLAIGVGYTLLLATLLISSLGSELMLPNYRGAPDRAQQRFVSNIRQLIALPSLKRELDARLAAQRQTYAMPLTQRQVGNASVDLFGFEHSRLTLNGLNYRPRPMGGGPFNVYTPWLAELNRAFLLDPQRRPDFYLAKLQSIDDRLLTQDDGPALVALLYLYQPVLVEHEHVLLRAIPGAEVPAPRLIERRTVEIGDVVPVPQIPADHLLLARFDVRPSLLGRIRGFLYKPPRLRITRHGPGMREPNVQRLVPAMAASPFLFSPVVDSTRHLLEVYGNRRDVWPREFRISSADRTWFDRRIGIEFYAMPRPPVSPGVDFDVLIHAESRPIEMVHTRAAQTQVPIVIAGQLLHAPNSLTWTLTGSERQVRFGFGTVPASYSHTDGVLFTLNLLQPGRPAQTLFERWLNPAHQAADRDHHLATISLPALEPNSRLELISSPGPHNNTAYDWAYVSDFALLDRTEDP